MVVRDYVLLTILLKFHSATQLICHFCPICSCLSRIRQTMIQPNQRQHNLVSDHHGHPVLYTLIKKVSLVLNFQSSESDRQLHRDANCGSISRMNNALFNPRIHFECPAVKRGRYVGRSGLPVGSLLVGYLG